MPDQTRDNGKKTYKYQVTISREGSIWVEATSPEEAIDIANRQMTDTVNWSEDWYATDVFEDDKAPDSLYITAQTEERGSKESQRMN